MHVLYSVAKQPTKIDKRSHSEGFTNACKHFLCNNACSNQRAGKCRYRMPAPIREQGMPALDQSECDNKAKTENRLENGKSPREWKIPKEATVGK